MYTLEQLNTILQSWATVLGKPASVGEEAVGRELWPVVAEDGRQYFLKRLGPWRNLPVADEARILRWLAQHEIDVAEFVITDRATIFAGEVEDSYILMPRLAAESVGSANVLGQEETIGAAVATLHQVLAAYPWSANSYREALSDALLGELLLPADVAEAYAGRREAMVAAIDQLPVQLVHGDLTPENVLLRRGQVAGFIDFDHLPLAPRVWDIAKYLSRRLRLRWRGGAGTGRIDHLAPMARGYHRVSPLTSAELAALPAAIAAGNVIEVSYAQQISDGLLDRRKLPDHDETLGDAIEAARWQLTHYDEVEAAIGSVG